MRNRLVAWLTAGALNALLVFPLTPMPKEFTVDGNPVEWQHATVVEAAPAGTQPDEKPKQTARIAIAYDGENLGMSFSCPVGRDGLTFAPINLPFSDALWRRGDRVEWIVRAGGEVFHHVFTPTGDEFRIIYKSGGFEEGHAADFQYKANITDANWCGEVKIPLMESPFPLPKKQPQWEMKILITDLKNGTTYCWPPNTTPALDSGYGSLDFTKLPSAPHNEPSAPPPVQAP